MSEEGTLSQWEAEAKIEVKEEVSIGNDYNNHRSLEANQRILALIDLVRKKDEALQRIKAVTAAKEDHTTAYIAGEALALTEKLK